MAEHNETGRLGEEAAEMYLIDNDYFILERNWRFKRAEIDVMAMDGDCLVCVEVKTRSTDFFGLPDEFVDQRKMRMLVDAAGVFAQKMHHDGEIRFDIISVISSGPQALFIKHRKDAFFPAY